MTIAEKVKQIRSNADLTGEEFGLRVGVTKGAISLIELGKQNLSERLAKDICRVYNVDYRWLMEDADVPMYREMTSIDKIADEYELGDYEKKVLTWYLKTPSQRLRLIYLLKEVIGTIYNETKI